MASASSALYVRRLAGTLASQALGSVVQCLSPYLMVRWLEYMLPRIGSGYWTAEEPALSFMIALVVVNVLYIAIINVSNECIYTCICSLENVVLSSVWDAISGTDSVGPLSSKLEAVWMHSDRFVSCARRLVDNAVAIVSCCIFLCIASPMIGGMLIFPLLFLNVSMLPAVSAVLKRIDAASLCCKSTLNVQLQERLRFDRTVVLCGRTDSETSRLQEVIVTRDQDTMKVLRSAQWLLLGSINSMSRQTINSIATPFLLLWLYKESSLSFASIWLITIYAQLLAFHSENFPSNMANALHSYTMLTELRSTASGHGSLSKVDSEASSTRVTQTTIKFDEVQVVTVSPILSRSVSMELATHVLLRIKDGEFAPILSSINAELPRNKVTVIFGPSGSGKSTLMDVLLGYRSLTGGSVDWVDDDPGVSTLKHSRGRLVSTIPAQDHVAIWKQTLRYNIAYEAGGFGASRLPSTEDMIAVLSCLRWSVRGESSLEALAACLDTIIDPARLSSGEKQRILLARALLSGKRVLFMDEGTSALPPDVDAAAWTMIQERFETIVLISHSWRDIARSDFLLGMENGTVFEAGAMADLLPQPHSLLRHCFWGDPGFQAAEKAGIGLKALDDAVQ